MQPAEMVPNNPDCLSVIRVIRVGGVSKRELMAELHKSGIELNEAAQTLFAGDRFTTSESSSVLETVEISVGNLGYPQGAVIADVYERAVESGLSLCPLELGPHLRLQYLDQPEGYWGHPPSQHRAPPGSITVASVQLTEDDDTPKGFYLRRIKGVLWLRGYRSSADHVYSPDDHFVFCRPHDAS